MTAEEQRLTADRDRQAYWRRWGPYLSERQWGTVREDYSADGAAWEHFPHEQARSRAYRWGEDGIAGISDNHQQLCFEIALWNGEDPILKERLFGLTGPEGNHGEDVKEYYFYLDNTPSHAYMKYLYKYPHAAFPYTQLVQENQRRGYHEPEFELADTGIFDDDLKVRSMVGLVPLFATAILESSTLERLPDFKRRFEWFIDNRPNLHRNLAALSRPGTQARQLLAIVNPIDSLSERLRQRLKYVLQRLLDETEFLSPYGVRSLSKIHAQQPYTFAEGGQLHTIAYEPAESTTGMFGGNSNWRGPIWLPMNFLIIESLQKFHTYLGDEFTVECPTGSGQWLTLAEVATELSHRSIGIFEQNAAGNRPVHGGNRLFQTNPHWRNLLLFYEHFNGDNGAGLGANHQTGWTGLVATLIRDCSERLPTSDRQHLPESLASLPEVIASTVDR
jgi:Glycosyl hydrolase family 63 C-terminal domain